MLKIIIFYLRMGFTGIEKAGLKSLIRSEADIEKARESFPEVITKFIRSNNLVNQVCDYARFPYMKHKQTKAENLEIVKIFDDSLELIDVLEEMGESLSAPYTLKIDCSFLIRHPEGESLNLRFISNN